MIQAQRLTQFDGAAKVPVVYRVEGAPEHRHPGDRPETALETGLWLLVRQSVAGLPTRLCGRFALRGVAVDIQRALAIVQRPWRCADRGRVWRSH
ncbi:hypothetical protein HHA02_33200 [Cobetia marina]|nr:hypothetical protein HHA02_33200 [Cobetia marina]